jgi:hypothetical protein
MKLINAFDSGQIAITFFTILYIVAHCIIRIFTRRIRGMFRILHPEIKLIYCVDESDRVYLSYVS